MTRCSQAVLDGDLGCVTAGEVTLYFPCRGIMSFWKYSPFLALGILVLYQAGILQAAPFSLDRIPSSAWTFFLCTLVRKCSSGRELGNTHIMSFYSFIDHRLALPVNHFLKTFIFVQFYTCFVGREGYFGSSYSIMAGSPCSLYIE